MARGMSRAVPTAISKAGASRAQPLMSPPPHASSNSFRARTGSGVICAPEEYITPRLVQPRKSPSLQACRYSMPACE